MTTEGAHRVNNGVDQADGQDGQAVHAYIEDLLGQLANMAEDAGDRNLATSIRVAEHEATRSLRRRLQQNS